MRTSLVIFAATLLVIAVFLATQSGSSSPSSPTPNSTPPKNSQSRRTTSPKDSLKFLRSLTNLDYNQAPTFAQVEARAGNLSDKEIFALLEDLDSSGNFAIWLRSALWAELGRRNHPDALPLLIDQADDTEFSIDARDQAAFAFFRGRIDSFHDFNALRNQLIPELNHFTDQDITSDWRSRTIKTLFKKLASLDRTATWDLVKQTDSDEHSDTPHSLRFTHGDNQSPLIGFFESLASKELVQSYLTEWQPTVETPEYRKKVNEYLHPTPTHDELRVSFRIMRLPPDKENLVHHHLAALARFDPLASLQWVATHQASPNRPDQQRIANMWKVLAHSYPDDAFSALSNPSISEYNFELAIALGARDFSRIPQIINALPDPAIQGQVLNRLTDRATNLRYIDNFPTPEGPNRIHNYPQRRESLLNAIDNSQLPEEIKQTHRENVEATFAARLD